MRRSYRIKKVASLLMASLISLNLAASNCWAKNPSSDQESESEKSKGIFSNLFQPSKRSHISVVGSSTVYPFAAVIAEKFGRRYSKYRTPTIEATGTGGGFKLFCSGVGYQFPDFVNASRPVKASEYNNCQKNGVKKITEIKIGYDGIVLANSNKSKPIYLTKYQLFLALADKVPQNGKLVPNFYKKWSDISPKLPDHKIRVYGPPPSSGTRDAFVELGLEKTCYRLKAFRINFPNKNIRKKKCHLIRNDGHFIEAGENDNLILQKLLNDKEAFGIFGFSFLNENKTRIQAAAINRVLPSIYNIKTQRYKISRPLFIYFKPQHLELIKGSKEFVKAIISPDAVGANGFLVQKGLIPLSYYELRRIRNKVLRSVSF